MKETKLTINQQQYVDFNMMEAMETTRYDDYKFVEELEQKFTKEAIDLGDEECERWMVNALDFDLF